MAKSEKKLEILKKLRLPPAAPALPLDGAIVVAGKRGVLLWQ